MIAVTETTASSALRAEAPAKLNLYLHILGRRPDGYHLLDSLVAFAAVHDVLTAEPAEELRLAVRGPFAGSLARQPDNLVLRAARLLAEHAGIKAEAEISLTKTLPVAAGIGGGSADAAAALKLLARLWKLRPAPEDLAALALKLGADVPVCLDGRATFVGGIGESIEQAPALPTAGLVLVNPGRPLATKRVFAHSNPVGEDTGRFDTACADAAALANVLRDRRNDLSQTAVALVPEIGEVLATLDAREPCLYAAMSGSGATCFGLFEREEDARDAASAIGAAHPRWWVVATRLLG